MRIIFITGASGSGKSTFARKLFSKMLEQGLSVNQLSMDDYFHEVPEWVHDIEHFRRTENFDQIEKYDLHLLTMHLESLRKRKAITKPIFDFPTNKRLSSEIIEPVDYVILEGLFALEYAKMLPNDFEKTTVFIGQSSYLELIKTRVKRDQSERALNESDVLMKERKSVGPAFFSHICKSKSGVDFDITNDACDVKSDIHPLDMAINEVLSSFVCLKQTFKI